MDACFLQIMFLGLGNAEPEATSSSTIQLVAMLLAAVMLTIVMIRTHRRSKQSRLSQAPGVRERYAALKETQPLRRDVQDIMVELDELARQIQGRLDTRFAKLETIIRDADQRIDTLSRLVRQSQGEPTLDVTLAAESPDAVKASQPPPVEAGDARFAEVYRLADAGHAPADIADQVGKPSGEIELILSLRRTRNQSGQPPSGGAAG